MLFAPKERGQALIEFVFILIFLTIIFYMIILTIDPKAAARMRFWE